MIKIEFSHTDLTRWFMRKVLNARLANLENMLEGLETEHRRALCGLRWAACTDRPEFLKFHFRETAARLNEEIAVAHMRQALTLSRLQEYQS